MKRYEVVKIVGENCITSADGQRIFDLVYPHLQAREPLEVDFSNVKILASSFLNAAIGQLLRDFEPEDLNELLKLTNLSAIARPILKRVIENAKSYYSNPVFREIVEQAIESHIGSSDAD